MNLANLSIIDEWMQLLSKRIKDPPSEILMNNATEILQLIESNYEGHAFTPGDNIMDVAILCLMVKHFSRHHRRVIVSKIEDNFKKILIDLQLDHVVLIDSTENDYRLIFAIGESTDYNKQYIHPMGSWFQLKENKLSPHYSKALSTLLRLPSIQYPTIGASELSYSDIVYLNESLKKCPEKKTCHLLILSMTPAQEVLQIIDLIRHCKPTSTIKLTIIGAFFLYDFSSHLPTDIEVKIIHSSWRELTKTYSITNDIDIILFNSTNYNIFFYILTFLIFNP